MRRYEELFAIVRDRFERGPKPARFRHVVAVVETAAALAERHGADVGKAKIAALLHDVAKNDPAEEQKRRIAHRYGPDEVRRWPPQLWHGLAAVQYAADDLGVDDPDILAAIENHSAGRPDMSLLEKIVFVADYVEPTRDYDNAAIRAMAFSDLDKAVALVLRETERQLASDGRARSPRGEAAWASYRHLLEE